MENAQAVSPIRVGEIVREFTQWAILGAYVRVVRGACRVGLCVKPETVKERPCRVIASEDVVRVGYPEASRGLIGV